MKLKNKQNLVYGSSGFESVSSYTSNKVKTAQKLWSFAGLFIICLVVSMPFYSANVMATTLSINTNTGTAGIDGFLNAESDTWTMQATVTNYDGTVASNDTNIDPSQMFLEVGDSMINFNSCSGDSFSTTCDFQSVLDDGISEGSFPFNVRLYDLLQDPDDENSTNLGSELASDSKTIFADGSEPSIDWNHLYQEDGVVYLDFDVSDNPSSSCVGLRLIEIIDSDSGVVLSSIQLEEIGDCSFNYANDGDMSGVLDAEITGEGKRQFKVRATDFLGHTKSSSARGFDTDFVSPSIISGSLELVDFGDYIGQYSQATDVSVKVKECGDLDEVVAYSEQMDFYSVLGDCDLLDVEEREVSDDDCTYLCTWDDITVSPEGSSSVEATFVALDEFGNEGSSDLVASFSIDSSPPVVEYIGTEYQYDDNNYVPASGQSKIIVKVIDNGIGINSELIALNLKSMGGTDWSYPYECKSDSSEVTNCYWEVNSPGTDGTTSTKEISLVYLEDAVGNSGETMSTEVVVDGLGPEVHEIEFYGYSAVGKKDYFQSNDDLVIELVASDSSGLTVYVDVSEIVMDSTNKYSYGEDVELEDGSTDYEPSEWDGWAKFTENDCERLEDTNWECQFKIDNIKSGYDSSANFQVIVADTAGNPSEWYYEDYISPNNAEDDGEGDFEIEIFALDEETQPDFWEQSSVSANGFIDLDIVELTKPRIMFDISFSNDEGAEARLIEIDECVSVNDGPTVSRALIYGGLDAGESPDLELILEFESFEPSSIFNLEEYETFTELLLDYNCTFDIYSVKDEVALNYAESQGVTLEVPFGYTTNGALDENLNQEMYSIVSMTEFQILDKLKYVSKVISWIAIIGNFINTIVAAIQVYKYIQEGLAASATAQEASGVAAGAAQATKLACKGIGAVEIGASGVIEFILKIPTLLSCSGYQGANNWYANWQRGVLTFYNSWKGDAFLSAGFDSPIPAANLEDNIWISMLGLCIPGIFHNLEKLRQIYCVQLSCIQNDVVAGTSTISGCQQTFDYLICKFWWGELVGLVIPFTGLFEYLKNLVTSILTDPIGDIRAILGIACLICCDTPAPGDCTSCYYIRIGTKVFDMIMGLWGGIQQIVDGNVGIYDYCSAAEIDTDPDSYKYKDEDGSSSSSVTTTDITSAESESSSTSSEEASTQ